MVHLQRLPLSCVSAQLKIGGGYVNPANCHFDVLDVCISNVDDASVVVLSYWLVPDARYPVQLLQATELLRHLIVNMGKSPSNVHLHLSNHFHFVNHEHSDADRR